MKNMNRQNFIVYFFLTVFLSIKFSGLHILANDGNQDHYDHCIVIDYIVKSQQIPELFNVDSEQLIIKNKIFFNREISNKYSFPFNDILEDSPLFYRPPPFCKFS